MLDYEEEEEYYSSDYSEEDEVYYNNYYKEVYPATRSGKRYITGRATYQLKKQSDTEELDELQRNTRMNAQTERMEGIEDTTETTEVVEETKKKKKQERMMPAPIELLTEFNIAEYLFSLPSGLTVGQAAHSIPKYRSEMRKAMQRSRERESEAYYANSDEENVTAAKCVLRINEKAIIAIVDSEAATSIMTKPLMKKLGYEPNRPSRIVVVTANGNRTRSLGIIDGVTISFGKDLRVKVSFQALESKDEILILGNDWLREANTVMDWNRAILTVKTPKKTVEVPIAFTNTLQLRQEKQESEEKTSSEEEYEQEELMESTLYYSDISYSLEEDCPEFNPWVDVTSLEYDERIEELEEENTPEMNPATFLAEVQVFTTELLNNKLLVVDPLEYEQQ